MNVAEVSAPLGRDAECAALERLLQAARDGHGSVLVLRGEPGVGKSVLLDYAATLATGFAVARAAGVESELELPLAGLQQLLGASLLDRAAALAPPQRDALRVAFGLLEGPVPDPFLVALAALGLLTDAADEQPLLCLVDDVQWLDKTSVQVLSFVARRLAAERLAIVFGVREPNEERVLGGLPELALRGLADHDARLLLDSVLPGGIDHQVRERIVAESHGNPLALLELPRGLSPAELAGGFGLPEQGVAGRVEASFMRRIDALPPATQHLLFVAAAEPAGDVTVLLRAVDTLGIPSD